jgi:N,N'-diacetylchitobiose phosphorylase
VQFVYGQDHAAHGRAKHPWLTGTAGWAYGAVARWILGVRLDWSGLVVDPCIPKAWPSFEVTRQWLGATYEIKVSNPKGVSKGVTGIKLNGKALPLGPIPPQSAGSKNLVEVEMG